jgi:predicted MFS family arabinose efflux permease
LQADFTRYSVAYKRGVTLLLMSAYACNSMDRSLISIVGQPMKTDLGLTDSQLGLLGGTAFALLYAFGGIPVARLAERFNRVNIITIALILWSSLSALCGAAAGFPQLLLTRMGVGIAEAGCSPPAHSLISDFYEPAERTSALSVYSCGTSLGYLSAAVLGGYIAQQAGWRTACLIVGVPGIVIALLIKIIIKEPPRGYSDTLKRESVAATAVAATVLASTVLAATQATRGRLRGTGVRGPFSLRSELSELIAVAKSMAGDRPVRHMVLGVTLGGFAAYGLYAFLPPYFNRVFHLNYTTVGIIAGLSGGVAVGLGILAGGFVADALARRDGRWYALVPAMGTLIAVPFYLLALLQSDWIIATGLLSLAGFFQYASLGPTFGVIQNAVGERRRATATALLYIALSVVALGSGPLFTGWTIDRFADDRFAQLYPTGSFQVECHGGIAAPTATPELRSACSETLGTATRRGMLVTLAFFSWASIHYFLAAAAMRRPLATH